MSKRLPATACALALTLVCGPAMAWEPWPGNEADAWTTITTITEIGMVNRGLSYIVVAEPLPATCPSYAPAYGRQFRDDWLGLITSLVQGGAPTPVVPQSLSVAMFARAQNVQVRVTIGGAAPNSFCHISAISTCFDANHCALPPP